MSNPTLPSANQAAAALLHLGFTLTGVLACLFFVVHFSPLMHGGEALLYGLGGIGAVLILRSLLGLMRELATPLPAPTRRTIKH